MNDNEYQKLTMRTCNINEDLVRHRYDEYDAMGVLPELWIDNNK